MFKSKATLELLVFTLIVAFPLFFNLGTKPIELWDESRNAVNAIEMLENGNLMVRHFKNMPDMWEVKPPLYIWIQQISFKIIGVTEFAIRFPSALATLFLILSIVYFMHEEFNLKYVGYLAGLVLVSSQGYISRHIARTGDHDATLVLFVSLYMFSFYKYFTSETGKVKYLLLGTVFLILSTYTKSIVSLMFLPGILVFAALKRKIISALKDPYLYVGIGSYIGVVASYYLYRESVNPGYLESVWLEELFPRYMRKSESVWYYIYNFNASRFLPWIYVIVPAIVYALIKTTGKLRDFLLLHLFSSMIFLYVISTGAKNMWYDALLYPTFSIFIGIAVYYLYCEVRTKKKTLQRTIIVVFAALFLIPYISIVYRIHDQSKNPTNLDVHGISYYLKDQIEQKNFSNKYVLVYNQYDAHIYFYKRLYSYNSGTIEIKKSIQKPDNSMLYMVCQDSIAESIEKRYYHELIDNRFGTKVYKLISEKD